VPPDTNDLLSQYPVGSPEWRWLMGIGDLDESAELAGISVDGLRRHHADKILNLSPRRRGMRRHVALTLGQSKG
jgi:hypothetical protein